MTQRVGAVKISACSAMRTASRFISSSRLMIAGVIALVPKGFSRVGSLTIATIMQRPVAPRRLRLRQPPVMLRSISTTVPSGEKKLAAVARSGWYGSTSTIVRPASILRLL